jgi:hypothetical protein
VNTKKAPVLWLVRCVGFVWRYALLATEMQPYPLGLLSILEFIDGFPAIIASAFEMEAIGNE